MHDLACVVHLHSTYSDGTGTVRQIARAGRRAGVDVVLLTDHDTLEARRRGEEGWYGDVLLLAGVEVSPRRRNHYLAFGIDEPIDHEGLDADGICRAVAEAGGIGFAAHPWSQGSRRFKRVGEGMPFDGLDSEWLDGVELWSFVTDTAEAADSIGEVLRFVLAPQRVLDHPPARNVEAWDELCRNRRVVAIGGLDAHQVGKRIGPVVPLQADGLPPLVSLHPHARALRAAPGRRARARPCARLRRAARRALLHRRRLGRARARLPLRGGRPAHGRRGAGRAAHAARPLAAARAAAAAPRRREIATAEGTLLDREVEEPGVYRVEALRHAAGRERSWVLTNPIYLR